MSIDFYWLFGIFFLGTRYSVNSQYYPSEEIYISNLLFDFEIWIFIFPKTQWLSLPLLWEPHIYYWLFGFMFYAAHWLSLWSSEDFLFGIGNLFGFIIYTVSASNYSMSLYFMHSSVAFHFFLSEDTCIGYWLFVFIIWAVCLCSSVVITAVSLKISEDFLFGIGYLVY